MALAKDYSTRSMPLLVWVMPALSIVYLCVCFAIDSLMPAESKDLVKWIDLTQALKESEKRDKPIMYDFSAAWCGPCRKMGKEVFGNKKSAQLINSSFVPVHVIDRQREDGANLLEVEALQKKYKIKAFPTLLITKPGEMEFKIQEGYGGRKATDAFFKERAMSAARGGYSLDVSWKKLDDVIDERQTSQKPLLILCWNEKGEATRWEYLGNPKLSKAIRLHFIPVEVRMPIAADSFKSPKSKALMANLTIKHSPALIIVPQNNDIPHFNIGTSSAAENEEFIQKYLQLSNQNK